VLCVMMQMAATVACTDARALVHTNGHAGMRKENDTALRMNYHSVINADVGSVHRMDDDTLSHENDNSDLSCLHGRLVGRPHTRPFCLKTIMR